MMLRLSAACLDSVKDAIQFADNLRAPSSAASPGEPVSHENAAKIGAPDASLAVPPSKPRSTDGCVTGHIESEPGQMFKILNSTGLGLACYTSWSDTAERVDLASTAQTTDLKFQPQSSMVYLPDLARKVCSEQDCTVLHLCGQSRVVFLVSNRYPRSTGTFKSGVIATRKQLHRQHQVY